MAIESKVIDITDEKILELLTTNGRATYAYIGKQVGLSAPAVKERITKMEEAGIITGYTVQIDRGALGFGIEAFMYIAVPPERYDLFTPFVLADERVRDCYHMMGQQAFLLRIQVAAVSELDAFIKLCLQKYGDSNTRLVLSKVKSAEIVSR